MSAISRKCNVPNKQKGFVLFIALVALVVMALASVALIRSVDTNAMIAGNLSFRQSALTSADKGIETAIAWIAANPVALDADNAGNGYYTSFWDTTKPAKDRAEVNAKVLVDAAGVPAKGVEISGTGQDSSGNTITYVIQRMCRSPDFVGQDRKEYCLLGPVGGSTSDMSVKDSTSAGAPTTNDPAFMYRVTVRVVGPKNTTSYAQAFIY